MVAHPPGRVNRFAIPFEESGTAGLTASLVAEKGVDEGRQEHQQHVIVQSHHETEGEPQNLKQHARCLLQRASGRVTVKFSLMPLNSWVERTPSP